MKRKETIMLENALIKETREKRIYGCEEITIGFHNAGKGDEIVDFMTMDSKGVIKCYELKVTLQDLKSNAKKSWYGHYNYLVTTKELYDKIDNWEELIPDGVGIIVGYVPKVGDYSYDYCNLGSKRKAKKNDIDQETENMLKESMIRSMYWKMVGYKDAKSIEKTKKLEAEVREQKKKADKWEERAEKAERLIYDYENYIYANNGVDIDFKDIVEKEKEKYLALRKKRREEKIKNKN